MSPVLVVTVVVFGAARGEQEDCPARLEERRLSAASLSLSSLAGSWVSVRCETRPGPGFVLRHYQWSDEGQVGQVTGVLYHYADPACRQPLYSLIFQARLAHLRPSWVLPGELAGWSLFSLSLQLSVQGLPRPQ